MITSEPTFIRKMGWKFTNAQLSFTSSLAWKHWVPHVNSSSWGSSYRYESTNKQTPSYNTWSNSFSNWYCTHCFIEGLIVIVFQGLLACLYLWSLNGYLNVPLSPNNGWSLRIHRFSLRHLCRRFTSGSFALGRMPFASHGNSW